MLFLFIFLPGFLLAQTAAVAPVGVSAWIRQSLPSSSGTIESTESRFYKRQDGLLRIESSQAGRALVQIINPRLGKSWLLFPKEKTYSESTIPRLVDGLGDLPPLPEVCLQLSEIECQFVGEELVRERPALKFRLTVAARPQLEAFQWLDKANAFPVRQQDPSGATAEAILEGKVDFEGRTVEHWRLENRLPNGQVLQAWQWYDPELKLNVREDYPQGMQRMLRDIRVENLPDSLFVPPSDYVLR
jgi:hypothetical protein